MLFRSVTGTGTITNATISTNGVTFTKAPTTITQTGSTALTVTVAGKTQDVPITPVVVTPAPTPAPTPGPTPTPTPTKSSYQFLVMKIAGPDVVMQWVSSGEYFATDKLNFDMVESVYNSFDDVPTYANNTIKDILQLKNTSDVEYIKFFLSYLSGFG